MGKIDKLSNKQQQTMPATGANLLFDDKAISFQRAVFIVCNLKRLIKRPKSKNNNSSGDKK